MEAKYDRKIYTKKALDATVEAYTRLADFEIDCEENYYKVRTTAIHDTEIADQLMDEFGNYALYQTIAEKKQWQ